MTLLRTVILYNLTESAPKQAKRSVKEKHTAPVVSEPARLTTEEVKAVEMEVDDTTDTGINQASLDIRGQENQPAKFTDESLFYNWKCMGRSKV